MKYIQTFENFINESQSINWNQIKKGDKVSYISADDGKITTGKVVDKDSTRTEDFLVVIDDKTKEKINVFMSYVYRINESLNEGKLTIHKKMDKAVKTPWGKGGPRKTVVVGKTSSGLDVTLNGDFVDAKANIYVTNPTEKDKEEAIEMIKFHHDRLTGGTHKESLAKALKNLE